MNRDAVLDHEKEIVACECKIEELQKEEAFSQKDLMHLQDKLTELKKKTYKKLSPWQRVEISRHPNRPRTIDYVENMFSSFEELKGDRAFRDDPAIITGLGSLNGQTFAIIGQEKGNTTESRVKRNFGMAHPEGFRKALRIMKLAEKFSLPIVCLLDTPGAYPAFAAEERGQGTIIANNLLAMAQIKVPLIAILIGEGCSGGALAIGMGDKIGMLENSYYSVISPEGCASILWKDASLKEKAAKKLKLLAEDLKEFKIIDEIIKEPLGGAHFDLSATYQAVADFISTAHKELKDIDPDLLIEQRYAKFRSFGEFEE